MTAKSEARMYTRTEFIVSRIGRIILFSFLLSTVSLTFISTIGPPVMAHIVMYADPAIMIIFIASMVTIPVIAESYAKKVLAGISGEHIVSLLCQHIKVSATEEYNLDEAIINITKPVSLTSVTSFGKSGKLSVSCWGVRLPRLSYAGCALVSNLGLHKSVVNKNSPHTIDDCINIAMGRALFEDSIKVGLGGSIWTGCNPAWIDSRTRFIKVLDKVIYNGIEYCVINEIAKGDINNSRIIICNQFGMANKSISKIVKAEYKRQMAMFT